MRKLKRKAAKKEKRATSRKKVRHVTLRDIQMVVNDLLAGKTAHGPAKFYDQRKFRGTACCVFGHAYAKVYKKTGLAPRVYLGPGDNFNAQLDQLRERYPALVELLSSQTTTLAEFMAYFSSSRRGT